MNDLLQMAEGVRDLIKDSGLDVEIVVEYFEKQPTDERLNWLEVKFNNLLCSFTFCESKVICDAYRSSRTNIGLTKMGSRDIRYADPEFPGNVIDWLRNG